jgi:hypothetical protein
MIDISVDEAYAFDYLSILEVKYTISPSKEKERAVLECKAFLQRQLPNFISIYKSEEYKSLYNINYLTFELVDQVRHGNHNITAKQVDNANMERYYKKQDLQRSFFSDRLVEFKS